MKSDILYHGSIIGGLDAILANARSHSDGGKVAYFTTDRVYALVCCRSREEKNVYEEILAEERAENVIIHRYEEIDPTEQKLRAEKLREYAMNNPQLTYREFIIKHFSPLWD